LANIYLHYVLDLWVRRWREKYAGGDVIIVRYADDFIVGFQHLADAKRFLRELRIRLAKFSLELHPEKTRLIEFGRYAVPNFQRQQLGKPETFSFLGFRHICAKTRNGKFLLMRTTMREHQRRKLQEVKMELRSRRHHSIVEQGKWLRRLIRGYYKYYAVPTNLRALAAFRWRVSVYWYRELRRRSQRDRIRWSRMQQIIARWLPIPRIQHPWPTERLIVTT
jgi:hypothetical protein